MTRIRRLYDKDQEVIFYNNPIIEPSRFSNHWLDWGEWANLEFGNKSYSPSDSLSASFVF